MWFVHIFLDEQPFQDLAPEPEKKIRRLECAEENNTSEDTLTTNIAQQSSWLTEQIETLKLEKHKEEYATLKEHLLEISRIELDKAKTIAELEVKYKHEMLALELKAKKRDLKLDWRSLTIKSN